MTRVAAWQRCASYEIGYPSAPSLGVTSLGCVNTAGITKSAEHRFSGCSRRLS